MPRRFLALVPVLFLLALSARAEDEVSLTDTSLALAVVHEPDIDVAKLKAGLEELEAKVKKRLEGVKDPAEVVKGLNEVLLLDRKVSYTKANGLQDSTLAAAVLRAKGNCLSTTTLYAVIGQRLGLPLHVVEVPGHIFVRFDDGATRINIETTLDGEERTDAYYHAMTNWTDEDAKACGWGRNLTTSEFAGALHAVASRHLDDVDKHTEALVEIDEALRLWPGNQPFLIDRLATVSFQPARRDEALQGYQMLSDFSSSPQIRSLCQIGMACRLEEDGKYEDSLHVLIEAFHDAPKDEEADVLSEMAWCYHCLRRFPEALLSRQLAFAATSEPGCDDYGTLAGACKDAGHLDDAIRLLREALELKPEDCRARLLLAGCLICAKKDEEGWATFKTAEKPATDVRSYESNVAWFFALAGKKKEFLEHLGAALDLATERSFLNWVDTEVDFDAFREDEEFKGLVEKHRKRLEKK